MQLCLLPSSTKIEWGFGGAYSPSSVSKNKPTKHGLLTSKLVACLAYSSTLEAFPYRWLTISELQSVMFHLKSSLQLFEFHQSWNVSHYLQMLTASTSSSQAVTYGKANTYTLGNATGNRILNGWTYKATTFQGSRLICLGFLLCRAKCVGSMSLRLFYVLLHLTGCRLWEGQIFVSNRRPSIHNRIITLRNRSTDNRGLSAFILK
jgi:hypothetical protein